MMTLDEIYNLAEVNREDIEADMEDAFSNTVSYEISGKYYPATRWEPEEYPDVYVSGYESYIETAVNAVLACFGDSWDDSDERLVTAHINNIMSYLDIKLLTEEEYYDKGIEYGLDDYNAKQAEAEERAYDYYMERKYDESRYDD